MKAKELFMIGLAAMLCMTFLSVPATAEEATDLSTEIAVETGTTTDLGGGEYFYLNFGNDARFGLVWGTEGNENNIYLVTVMSRYIASATITNAQGTTLVEDHLLKIYTIHAVKLDSIIEYSDGSGDGIASYVRAYDGSTGTYSDYTSTSPDLEPLFKRVDLAAAWEQSEVDYSEEDGVRTWTFSLTARDLAYEAIADGVDTSVGNGVLDNMTLTFNLQASTEHIDGMSVPNYNVTLTNSGFVKKVQQGEGKTYSGNVTSYDVKWDKDIEGWDFDPLNSEPMLLMEYGLIVGNYIPASTVVALNTWQFRHMVAYMGEDGAMWGNGSEGSMNETTGSVSANKQALYTNRLTFRGENTNIATYEWVQNATVDGEQEQVKAQVVAAHAFAAMHFRGSAFTGFIALMGMSFPGGNSIVQDPSISTDIVTDLTESSNVTVGGESFLSQYFGALVLGAVCAGGVTVGVVVLSRRKGRSGPGTFDKKTEKETKEWSKYYDKK
ncbi:MAG: hypothetical protein LLG16_06830 [Euryarchaeota archaeon]|nr:hypothetical protein [Euryarchaeota archaeon]